MSSSSSYLGSVIFHRVRLSALGSKVTRGIPSCQVGASGRRSSGLIPVEEAIRHQEVKHVLAPGAFERGGAGSTRHHSQPEDEQKKPYRGTGGHFRNKL